MISNKLSSPSGKFFHHLTHVPSGTTIIEHLNELKSRRSAAELFISAMEYPKKQLENRTRLGSIDGRSIGVIPWATAAQVLNLHEKIRSFDSKYSPDFRNKNQLRKMPIISEFFDSPDHCRVTEFTLEFRLCGKNGCHLCQLVGRSIRTPDVDIGKMNLREEVLRFIDLTIPNPTDRDHYLSPKETRRHINKQSPSQEMLRSFIPNPKLNSTEAKITASAKTHDKMFDFRASKVRGIMYCNSCLAPRCFYSDHCVRSQEGPT